MKIKKLKQAVHGLSSNIVISTCRILHDIEWQFQAWR
jgi:hypothetical protein